MGDYFPHWPANMTECSVLVQERKWYAMSNWLQNQFKAAEGLLEAVDRTAKHASKKDLTEEPRRFSAGASEGEMLPRHVLVSAS